MNDSVKPKTMGLTTKALQTRATLISAARQLAGSEGLNGVTVISVCELANVGRTSFYNYFVDIESLLVTVGNEASRQFQKKFESIHGDMGRGLGRLERCLSMILETACEDKELALLVCALSDRNYETRALLFQQIELELNAATVHGEIVLSKKYMQASCDFLTTATMALMREFAMGNLTPEHVRIHTGFLLKSLAKSPTTNP